MLPGDLKPEQFNGYPPEARKLATQYLAALQRLPLSFLPSLLREVIEYDFKFPVERKAVDKELANLLPFRRNRRRNGFRDSRRSAFRPTRERGLGECAGAIRRTVFGHLWATHQLDAFRAAATGYADRVCMQSRPRSAADAAAWHYRRGQGRRRLRRSRFSASSAAHGVYFTTSNRKTACNLCSMPSPRAPSASRSIRSLVCRRWRGDEVRSRAHLRLVPCAGACTSGFDRKDARRNRETRNGAGSVAHADGAHASRRSWIKREPRQKSNRSWSDSNSKF